MTAPPDEPKDPTLALSGVDALRAVAEAMFRVRTGLEHADVTAARHAAQHLVIALEALPTGRAEYEALCELADRELEKDPNAWVPGEAPDGGRG